jgi:photosystem II stability/assembly factor-like uncharacterized protein
MDRRVFLGTAAATALAPTVGWAQDTAGGWVKLPTEPYRCKHDDISFVDALTCWYGNGAGKLFRTTDGGQTWRSRNKGMAMDHTPEPEAEWGHDTHFIDLCPGQPDNVWQQNHAGVFFSDDGAATWKAVNAKEQGVYFGFPVATHDTDGQTAWLVPGHSDQQRMTIGGSLFVARPRDGGQTWEKLTQGLPQSGAYDVVYRHALAQKGGVVAFGSTTGNLYLSEDGGDTWIAASNNLPPIYSVRFG